jgi:flagellar hook protein FlgE
LGPQSFLIDIRKITQLADNNKLTVQNIEQDGYIEGRLDRTYFNGFGEFIGSYSNGEVRTLFKLPVAAFVNEGKLEAKSGNVFVETHESGDLLLKGLGDPTGTTQIVTGALEQSNVDLADQFSKMIVTQRAYSSAAKVLTTADEMTMAARDLKR